MSSERVDPRNVQARSGIRLRAPRAFLLFTAVSAAAANAPVAAQPAAEQQWPVRSMRVVHGFTSGGAVDLLARLMAQQLSLSLGQQVLVDGRPGAGGTIGAATVARSAADGYTLFLMASGHATAPGLFSKLPYDAVRDFSMVSMVASSPFVVLANPSAPVKTIQDLIAHAKAEPGRINYGTGGIGSGMHLAAVLFQGASPREAIRMLMERELKAERWT